MITTQFYLKSEHVGKVSRAEASISELTALNKYVAVSVVTGSTEKLLDSGRYQVCAQFFSVVDLVALLCGCFDDAGLVVGWL